MEKKRLEKDSIKKTSTVEVEAVLSTDYARYSNGTIMMSATSASFKTPSGVEGKIYTSMGGNEVEVKIGGRSWRVNLSALVCAVIDIDEAYQKENPL
jgi:hypothetical protein